MFDTETSSDADTVAQLQAEFREIFNLLRTSIHIECSDAVRIRFRGRLARLYMRVQALQHASDLDIELDLFELEGHIEYVLSMTRLSNMQASGSSTSVI